MSSLGRVFSPCFVVIRITPLAEREPYMAADAASFKTSIDSISAGFISSMDSKGTPSTMYRGFAPPSNVDVPRIRISAASPGAPDPVVICTPAVCPCNASAIEIAFRCSIVSDDMEAMAPVTSRFFIAP